MTGSKAIKEAEPLSPIRSEESSQTAPLFEANFPNRFSKLIPAETGLIIAFTIR